MAKFLSQDDIDLYKECFFYIAKRGYTTDERELATIMRSLSTSPTHEEVHYYFNKYVKGDGKIDFASFLEVMHNHLEKENATQEILKAFRAQDESKTGYVQTSDARRILMKMGTEGLSRPEVETLFRDGNVTGGQLRYQDMVNNILTPAPDY